MTAGSRDPLRNSFVGFGRDKRSLAAIVRDAGRLCVADSVDLVLDVCDELANAHANGIVHGDLGLHRVRTLWPRQPGDTVDIFALDADDTGAIDFRAAFQTPAQAPEQRAGRVGDFRSDIWAVGAILHALVGGQPPTKRPVREVLTGAPQALIACVEQCLAENPAARPQSIDDVAAALASFASTPPERFQQLARRRIAAIKAKHVSAKVAALGKLDDAAVKRESGDRILAVTSLSSVVAMPKAPEAAPPVRAAEIPPPPPTRQHSYDDISVEHEPPTTSFDPPTAAAPRETLPPIGPAPLPRDVVKQTTKPIAQEQVGVYPHVRQPRNTSPMFHPWLQHPSMAPPPPPRPAPVVYEQPMQPLRSASVFRAAPVTGSVPMMPAAPMMYPGTATVAVPPAPQAYRQPSQPSYHPASLGPVVVDSADSNGIHIPPAGRVPSFADLDAYRQAKRESRRAATFAVLVAAAVLILGFGFGSRMLERDRAALQAAKGNQSSVATQPATPVTALPAPVAKNAAPAAEPATTLVTSINALPTAAAPTTTGTSVSSLPTTTSKPATKRPRRHATPATPAPTSSQDDRPDTAPTNAFSDALGKKEAAPADALENAL